MLTLAGSNTYTGSTTVNGGTLKVTALARGAAFRRLNAGIGGCARSRHGTTSAATAANATVPSGNGTPTYIANAGTGTGLGAINFTGGSIPNNNSDSQASSVSLRIRTSARLVFSIFKGSSFLITDSGSS